MSLDDELRSAFEREALTRPAPPPDPDGLIRGGRARRRRRNLERAGAGVAAVVLIGAGGYALAPEGPRDPGVASVPSGSTTPVPRADRGRPELAPGTYRTVVGRSALGERIEADFTVEGDNWSSGDFPLVGERYGASYAGVGVYQPHALAAGRGCLEDGTTTSLGLTSGRLAEQLAGLPRSTVVREPTPTRAFGYTGVHLRLRIDVTCPSYYRLADAPTGHRGITYSDRTSPVDVVIDFWVLDVAGAAVVVDQWHNVDASDDLVETATRARESIELVVAE